MIFVQNTILDEFFVGTVILSTIAWIFTWILKTKYTRIIQCQDITLEDYKIQHAKLTSELELAMNKISSLEASVKDLDTQNLAFKEQVKSRDSMLTNVSHELRNPLNSLLGNIDLLLDELSDPKQREMLDISRICGEVLLNLINNLLDAAKISNDKLELSLAPFDMYHLFEKVWKIKSIRIRQKHLDAQLYISRNFPKFLMIDSQRVMQIMINLIGNAIKFTEKGNVAVFVTWYEGEMSKEWLKPSLGFKEEPYCITDSTRGIGQNNENTDEKHVIHSTIRTEASGGDQARNKFAFGVEDKAFNPKFIKDIWSESFISFSGSELNVSDKLNFTKYSRFKNNSSEGRGTVKIEIIDTGCGISNETQRRIFQPVIQPEDPLVARRYGGSGIGLYIVKNILSKMSGIIKLYSEKNCGSDVIVLLQAEKVLSFGERLEQFSKTIQSGLYTGHKVLVVEDNIYHQKILKSYLEKLGIVVTVCNDGEEAYQTFSSKGKSFFTFITMDVQMPKMDGLITARKIRQHEKLTRVATPVTLVFISGNCGEEERLQCIDPNGDIQAGFFLRKPITYSECQKITYSIIQKDRTLNLLIVDDDPFNILLLSKHFQANNINYDICKDEIDALNRLKANQTIFHGVVMDCDMPNMDPYTATQEIKLFLKSHKRKDIPIVGISGTLEYKNEDLCLGAGMKMVFHKPIDFNALIAYMKS
jgi:signal transduction histidine kinase/CheY-like chemotaxis protein